MKTLFLQLYLILAILWGLVSCVPKAIIVDPIAPQVAKAHGDVKAAAAGAKRVQAKVVTVHGQSVGIAAAAGNLVAETDRLRNLPGVPLGEFDALWTMANDLKRETWAHEIQARETVSAAAEQEQAQVAAGKSMTDLDAVAVKTDQGVSELKTQVVKQADDASLGRALKGVFWMAVAAGVIGCILLAILKFRP